MADAPRQTNVYIVDSDAPPAGVGEPGVPPFVAAFCNAVFAATGKRVRDLPITKSGLSWYLLRLATEKRIRRIYVEREAVRRDKTRQYVIRTFPIPMAVVAFLTFYPVSTVSANRGDDSAGSAATYKSKCSLCHGPDGASSAVGKTMKVPDLRSDGVQKRSDADLAQIISEGKGGMPSFKKSLSEDRIRGLVTYIRTLAPKK
jgi:cytochrome c553